MKKSKNILKILTAVFAVIGLCVIALLCFIFIYIYINGSFPQRADSDSLTEPVSVQEESPENDAEDLESVQQSETAVEEASPTPVPTPTAPPPKTVESGSYNINGTDFWFSDSVINDTSGRLKISSLASEIDISEYAAAYYNTLFGTDNEIHAVVNFTTNTTSSISVLQDGMLSVSVHEYVPGEEHDAQTLFSGMMLEEYFVNIETGEVRTN